MGDEETQKEGTEKFKVRLTKNNDDDVKITKHIHDKLLGQDESGLKSCGESSSPDKKSSTQEKSPALPAGEKKSPDEDTTDCSDEDENTPEICAICLNDLPDPSQKLEKETRRSQLLARIIPCGHLYHDFCIQTWAEKANTCPQCRSRFHTVELLANDRVVQRIHVDDKMYPMEVDESIVPEFPEEGLSPDGETDSSGNRLPAFRHQHLEHQLCCLCDRSTNSPFVICSECSSGYHLSCLGISEFTQFNCPMCNSTQGLDSVVAMDQTGNSHRRQRHMRRRRRRRQRAVQEIRDRTSNSSLMQQVRRQVRSRRYARLGVSYECEECPPEDLNISEDGIDYVRLADRNKKRAKQLYGDKDKKPAINEEEQMAWKILDKLRSGKSTEGGLDKNDSEGDKTKKYKRPKCHHPKKANNGSEGSSVPARGPTKLTERALSLHDRRIALQQRKKLEHDGGLSYNQKVIIQRLLVKPALKKRGNMTVQEYTKANRAVSRRLYTEIFSQPQILYRLNVLQERAEREGIDMSNKHAVDHLLCLGGDNELLKREFQPKVEHLVDEELAKI